MAVCNHQSPWDHTQLPTQNISERCQQIIQRIRYPPASDLPKLNSIHATAQPLFVAIPSVVNRNNLSSITHYISNIISQLTSIPSDLSPPYRLSHPLDFDQAADMGKSVAKTSTITYATTVIIVPEQSL